MKIRDLMPRRLENLGITVEGRDPFSRFEREFRDLTDRFWGNDFPVVFQSHDAMAITPKVDVKADEHTVTVTAEIPGVDQKDINVKFEKNHLILSGEKKSEHEENKEGIYRCERSYGSFYRAIPIEHEVKENEAKASFKNGVLKIELPRSEEDKKGSKNIPITAA